MRKRPVSLLHDVGMATGGFGGMGAPAGGFEAVAFGSAGCAGLPRPM